MNRVESQMTSNRKETPDCPRASVIAAAWDPAATMTVLQDSYERADQSRQYQSMNWEVVPAGEETPWVQHTTPHLER
jgi:hypothetical protein